MDHNPTPEPSPELTKRSWFGSLMSTDKDETYTIIVKGKPLASIKADLIHAFLSVSKNLHWYNHEPVFLSWCPKCPLYRLREIITNTVDFWVDNWKFEQKTAKVNTVYFPNRQPSKVWRFVWPWSLLQQFQITDLQHSVTSPMSFRLEYKRGSGSGSGSSTPAMFQRQVRMQVDISHISKTESGPEALYAITFTLLSGEIDN